MTVVEPMVIWPAEMPLPNDLCYGDVVVYANAPHERRVVVRTDSFGNAFLSHAGELDGHRSATRNDERQWLVVPVEEQTLLERLTVATLTFEPPTETDDEEALSDTDTLAWHWLAAILPLDVVAAMIGDLSEWPDNWDLAVAVAERFEAMEDLLCQSLPHIGVTGPSARRQVRAQVEVHLDRRRGTVGGLDGLPASIGMTALIADPEKPCG